MSFADYDGDAISDQEWGAMDDEAYYSNDFVESTVRRSNRLKCSSCGRPLPMGSRAVFELECGTTFKGVHCMDCYRRDGRMQVALLDQRHPMDLED